MNGGPARIPLAARHCPVSVRSVARRSRAVNRQRVDKPVANAAGILRSYDPHVIPGCHSGEKDVVQDAAHLGIRAGSQGPTRAILMQQQRHLVAGAVGGEVGPERPDIRGRYGCDPEQTVRFETCCSVSRWGWAPLTTRCHRSVRSGCAWGRAKHLPRSRLPKRCLGPAPRPR